MAPWRVPLADVRLTDDEVDAAIAAYRSGWLSMGPRTASFERAFAAFTGARHALAVANGTAALHLLCVAAGIARGDEVVVPSLTFVATVNAVVYAGARPVFADVASPTEPWLSAAAVEAALTPRTTAILAMAYGGHPGELRAIAALAERRGLLLLEDAAHAAGARSGGVHLGTLGAAGAFSFFANKNLAVGEGGAVVTDDDELAERVRLRRSHGMTSLSWDRHEGHRASYDVVALGFNYRIDEARAALAERALLRLDEDNRRRAALVGRYRAALAAVDGIALTAAPPDGPGDTPAHHLFTIVLDEGADRGAFRERLAEHGVQSSVHYPPAHHFALYADERHDLPCTDAYAARTVTLPLFPHMTPEEQDVVLAAVTDARTPAFDR